MPPPSPAYIVLLFCRSAWMVVGLGRDRFVMLNLLPATRHTSSLSRGSHVVAVVRPAPGTTRKLCPLSRLRVAPVLLRSLAMEQSVPAVCGVAGAGGVCAIATGAAHAARQNAASKVFFMASLP